MLIALGRVLAFDSVDGVEGTGGGDTVSGGKDTDEAGAERELEKARDRTCIREATGVFDLVPPLIVDAEVYDEDVVVAVAGSSSRGVGG